jgi:hypothetical protein
MDNFIVELLNALIAASVQKCSICWKHQFEVFINPDGTLDFPRIIMSFWLTPDYKCDFESWHGFDDPWSMTLEQKTQALHSLLGKMKYWRKRMRKRGKMCRCFAIRILTALLNGHTKIQLWNFQLSLDSWESYGYIPELGPHSRHQFSRTMALVSIRSRASFFWYVWNLALDFGLVLRGLSAIALSLISAPNEVSVSGPTDALLKFAVFLANVFKCFKVGKDDFWGPRWYDLCFCGFRMILQLVPDKFVPLCSSLHLGLKYDGRDTKSDQPSYDTNLVFKNWMVSEESKTDQTRNYTCNDLLNQLYILRAFLFLRTQRLPYIISPPAFLFSQQCRRCVVRRVTNIILSSLGNDCLAKIMQFLDQVEQVERCECTFLFPGRDDDSKYECWSHQCPLGMRYPCCKKQSCLKCAYSNLTTEESPVPGNKEPSQKFVCFDCAIKTKKCYSMSVLNPEWITWCDMNHGDPDSDDPNDPRVF